MTAAYHRLRVHVIAHNWAVVARPPTIPFWWGASLLVTGLPCFYVIPPLGLAAMAMGAVILAGRGNDLPLEVEGWRAQYKIPAQLIPEPPPQIPKHLLPHGNKYDYLIKEMMDPAGKMWDE